MSETEESISLPRDSRSRSKRLKSKTVELGKRTLHRLRNKRFVWKVMEGLKPGERHSETPRVLMGYAKLRKSTHRRSEKKYLVLRRGMLTVYSHRDNLRKRNKEELQADLGLCSVKTNRLTRRVLIDLGHHAAYYIKTTRADYDTWIQKLKEHRLYRQDELRFGSLNHPKLTPFAETGSLKETTHGTPSLQQLRRPPTTEQNSPSWLKQMAAIDNRIERNRNLMRRADQLLVQLTKSSNRYLEEQTPSDAQQSAKFKESTNAGNQRRLATEIMNDFLLAVKSLVAGLDRERSMLESEGKRLQIVLNKTKPDLDTAQGQGTALVRTKSAITPVIDTRIKPFPTLNKTKPDLTTAQATALIRTKSVPTSARNTGIKPSPTPQPQAQTTPQTTVMKPKPLQPQLQPPTRTLSQPALLKPLENKAEVQSKQAQTIQQQEDDESEHSSSSDDSTTASMTTETITESFEPVTKTQSNDQILTKRTSAHSKKNEQSPAPNKNIQAPQNKKTKESAVPQTPTKETIKLEAPLKETAFETEKVVPQSKETPATILPLHVKKSPVQPIPLKKPPTIRRTKLPAPQNVLKSLSIWKLLAGLRGHHPVTMHEPLNSLQLSCEELEHSYLLDEACKEPDSCERAALVTAFAIARYSTTAGRGGRKPFAPLKGETYENDRWEEKEGWRYHSEQTDNYPHVSAVHAEGKAGWTWTMTFSGKMSFSGTVEFVPQAYITLTLDPFNESYTWNKVKTLVHNVLQPSKCTLTHVGVTKLQCSNGLYSQVSFEKDGHELVGGIFKDEQLLKELMGKWSEGLFFKGNAHKWLFKANPLPPDAHIYYGFSQFARELNELDQELNGKLPPTDSRFRPDIRCMELGQFDKAEEMKDKMDVRLDSKATTPPLWFVQSPRNSNVWISNGKYWTARDAGFHNISFPTLW